MTALELLRFLNRRGVTVNLNADKTALQIVAPCGLKPEWRAGLVALKPALLAFLQVEDRPALRATLETRVNTLADKSADLETRCGQGHPAFEEAYKEFQATLRSYAALCDLMDGVCLLSDVHRQEENVYQKINADPAPRALDAPTPNETKNQNSNQTGENQVGEKVKLVVPEVVPAGTYETFIAGIESVKSQFNDKDQFRIKFSIGSGKHFAKTLTVYCNKVLTPKSKLYALVSAALFAGNPIPPRYELDMDELANKGVLLIVKVESNDNGKYNKVESFMPLATEEDEGEEVLMVEPAFAATA